LNFTGARYDPMKYRVSDLTIDTGPQAVSRDGGLIALPKLSYELLLVLVRAAPNLVSLDELMRLVWPGIVVSPETVSQRIKLLRDALGDDPREPRYIAGLRGRGYQMVAAVKALEADLTASSFAAVESRPPPSPEPAAPRPKSSRNRLPLLAVFAVFVLALAWILADKFWIPKPIAQEKLAGATPASPDISMSSIVVLPFVDMSEKKDQEYFSDGLSEELIELLGKTQGLRVIARTSSFYFKGRAEKIDAIAAELRVANVLEGSVRKSGDRLRVTAQLIRADTSEHLWSETFDRDLRDVFKVQDEISSAVVVALKIHLLPIEPLATQSKLHTENLEAYNLYLQGRQSYNQGDAEGYQRAVTAFQAATALDPRYAVAYADLALARFWLADPTTNIPGYESALAAAEKAVTLAPDLAVGYSARGFIRGIYRFDFAGAQVDLDRAVALNPSDATVLHRSAVLLAVFGKLPEAIAREEKALALDPLSEEICRRLGFFLVANQQLAQARPLYEKALLIAPSSWHARFNLGDLELLENRQAQALSDFQQTEGPWSRLYGQAKAGYSLGHLEASQRALDELIANYGKTSDWTIAKVYAWRGEKDKTFEWLERAYMHKDTGLTWLKIDPDFRSLRDEPRYKALLKKMNLPE
jgi:TolB-like protein/DNA-binding winged helix-turn-helix (wHTH) protein/Flp pilus assembly protein TadD